jgi:cytoskeletal protein RodZ
MDESAATPASSPEATAAPAVARSVGERLRAGREKSGLSVPAAAEKLHLDNRVIEALEADRFAELGASVYVRGHLRRYAEFVGENGTELLNMYLARETRQAAPDLTQVPHPERRADPRRLLAPAVILVSAAVLLGAVWWVLSGSKPAPPLAVAEDIPVTAPGVAATPATLTSSTAVPAPEIAPAPTTATPVVATPAAATPAAAKPVVESAPVPAREIRLDLELTNDSWIEVYDSRGERLYADVASGGSVRSVSGRGPLRVYLGVPAGITVRVDGERREIPDNAIDAEGARFIVNRSGSLSRAR